MIRSFSLITLFLALNLTQLFVAAKTTTAQFPKSFSLQNRQSRKLQQSSNPSDLYPPYLVQGKDASVGSIIDRPLNPVKGFEAIIGNDTRMEVIDVLEFPYNTVGKLKMDCPCRPSECTGTLISPRVVLTAAHCIHDVPSCSTRAYTPRCCEQKCTNITFTPSYPEGSKTYKVEWEAVQASFIRGFLGGLDIEEYAKKDIALLALGEDAPSDVETMTYGFPGCTNENMQLFVAGYPGDKDGGKRMYVSECLVQVDTCSDDLKLLHTCDTTHGMSGSSIWARDGERIILRGIHSRGHSQQNTAVMFTADMARSVHNTAQNLV